VAVAGLLPFLLYAPRIEWVRLTLVVLLFVYVVCKARQCIQARTAIKQMRLEQQFVLYSYDMEQLYACIRSADHLWKQSCILTGLRSNIDQPRPPFLQEAEKRQRVHDYFIRAFKKLHPRRFNFDPILLFLIAGGLINHGFVLLSWTSIIVQVGLLALVIVVVTEIICSVFNQKLLLTFRHFEDALTQWTLESIYDAIAPPDYRPYRHRLLYSARAWFTNAPVSSTKRDRAHAPVRTPWPKRVVASK